jgi:GAF domain-containing protein
MPIGRAHEFAELARTLAAEPTLAATLDAIVHCAVDTVPGAEFAGVTVERLRAGLATVATTDERMLEVDRIQYQADEGPCVDSIKRHQVLRSHDLANDPRWPVLGRLVGRTQVISMLSYGLFMKENDTIAVLNLYSTKPAAFTETSLLVLDVFATHCAIALSKATEHDENEHYQRALESNRTIGVAMGILMSRHGLTVEEAFTALRVASQHTHRKIRDIAEDVQLIGDLDQTA